MHILALASWYPSPSNPAAGLFIYEQMLALSRSGDVTVSLLNWGPNEYSLKVFSPGKSLQTLRKYITAKPSELNINPSFTQYNLPHLTWTSHLLKGNYDSLVPKLKQQIAEITKLKGKIDLIHAHVTFPAGYLAMHLSNELHIPYLITEHSGPFPFREFVSAGGVRDILLQPLRRASRLIAVSSWLSESIRKYTDAIPVVLPNAVDTNFFQIAPHDRQVNAIPTIFCLSWLQIAKGISELLTAVKTLKDKGLVFRLRIGGSGKDAQAMQLLSTQLGIADYVQWLGVLDRQQAREEFCKCDFYVMPSRLESLSMVILEATACGKPVVATDCGGPRDILSPGQGFLVEPGNYSALSNGIEKMLKEYSHYDNQTIRQLCLAKASPQIISDSIKHIYSEVISTH